MKKLFAMLVVLGLLILPVGGCGVERKNALSSAPEVAVSSALPEWSTTTSTEKATPTENLPSYSTTYRYHTTRSTTYRCPLTSQTTATIITYGKTNANCTYPTAPFTVGAAVREQDEHFNEDFRGTVITSKAQLDALALDAEYDTERYTEQFFVDKALIVLEFRLTSGSIRLRIDTVGVNGGTITVFYTTVRPSPFTNDMAYHRILLQVDRKRVDHTTSVVGEENRINSNYSNPTAF